ncbi:hypothetical protein R3Q06_32660 [Rhodococcus erythropolis]|uniref:hypothetical protein n=1 Tax=Rhodococcus erythropolis TaxID=1833 RepID=UPI00294998AB|nr:hypothetical protein [Rhodococcus erythropolis]MDV6278219.1 hypothetical protein [Rhodococcus erythropolis]
MAVVVNRPRPHLVSRAARVALSGTHARWLRGRWQLTPQERVNLRAARTPLAVVTASLGGGSTYR